MTQSSFWQQSGPELTHAFHQIMERMRQDYATALELIGEMEERGIHSEAGYGNLRQFISHLGRLHPREAARMVRHADSDLAATREAATAGVLDRDHLEVITSTMSQLPDWVDRSEAEHTLLEAARSLDAKALSKVGDRLLATVDPDGTEPSDEDPEPARNLLRFRHTRTGRTVGEFTLEATTGALMDTLLTHLADAHHTQVEGPDLRTMPERHGDAFEALLHLAADSKQVPTRGRERAHLSVHVNAEALRDELGHALLDGGGFLPIREARMLACDCKILPIVLNANSAPLDVGRLRYTVPMDMRRALIARDLGCAFPGCSRRPRECHAHHVLHWADGGRTAINNLVLLCGHHHRLIHSSEWGVAIINGIPEFTPPTWLDKDQRPLRNQVHLRLE